MGKTNVDEIEVGASTLREGANMVLGTATGTKIGTATA